MKRLLIFAWLLIAASCYAAFPAHMNTTTVDVSKVTGNFDSWNWVWPAVNDQTCRVTFAASKTNGYPVSYVDLTGYYPVFRISKRGTMYVDLPTTNITVTGSNIVFGVSRTNVPPADTYQAEVWLYDTAATNMAVTLAQGTITISKSLYSDTNNFPFPDGTDLTTYTLLTTFQAHTNATGTSVHGLGSMATRSSNDFYLVSNPSNYVTATVTNGLASTSYADTVAGNASNGAIQVIVSYAYTNATVTNGLASIVYVDSSILSATGTLRTTISAEIVAATNAAIADATNQAGSSAAALYRPLTSQETQTLAQVLGQGKNAAGLAITNVQALQIGSGTTTFRGGIGGGVGTGTYLYDPYNRKGARFAEDVRWLYAGDGTNYLDYSTISDFGGGVVRSAVTNNTSDFATASQGAKADMAVTNVTFSTGALNESTYSAGRLTLGTNATATSTNGLASVAYVDAATNNCLLKAGGTMTEGAIVDFAGGQATNMTTVQAVTNRTLTIMPLTDSTNSIRLCNTLGNTNVFWADTTRGRIILGSTAPSVSLLPGSIGINGGLTFIGGATGNRIYYDDADKYYGKDEVSSAAVYTWRGYNGAAYQLHSCLTPAGAWLFGTGTNTVPFTGYKMQMRGSLLVESNLTAVGNAILGGTVTISNTVTLYRASDTPPTAITNACQFFVTNALSSEMWVMDGAGNATQISPHESTKHVAKSYNVWTGQGRTIDLDELADAVSKLTGNTNIVRKWTVPATDWTALELAKSNSVRQAWAAAVAEWAASTNADKGDTPVYVPYVPAPEPKFISDMKAAAQEVPK